MFNVYLVYTTYAIKSDVCAIYLVDYTCYSWQNWILSCRTTFNLERSREISWSRSLSTRGGKFRSELMDRGKKRFMLNIDRLCGTHFELVRDTFLAVVKSASELIRELTANRYSETCPRSLLRLYRRWYFSSWRSLFFAERSPLCIYEHLMCTVEKHDDAYSGGISNWRNGSNASRKTSKNMCSFVWIHFALWIIQDNKP